MRAAVIGGTRGVGKAVAVILRKDGWKVWAPGRKEFDIWDVPLDNMGFGLVVWCAWDFEALPNAQFEYAQAPYVWAPILLADNGTLILVSSIAAALPAKVNPHYAAAKAAMESYARTLAMEHPDWRVIVHRLDLVDTDMAKLLPKETKRGRKMISAKRAAEEILEGAKDPDELPDPAWGMT